MNRRIAVISSVSLGLLLSVATLAVLWRDNSASKITVSFVNAETSYAANGALWNVECERLALDVRNGGKTSVRFEVSDIKDEHGTWFRFDGFSSDRVGDDAAAGKTAHLYLYLPKGSHPQALRVRGYKKANKVEKAQYALRLLSKNPRAVTQGNKVWFEKLSLPAYEFIVRIETKGRTNGLSQ